MLIAIAPFSTVKTKLCVWETVALFNVAIIKLVKLVTHRP